jgi:dihydropteroate synthase
MKFARTTLNCRGKLVDLSSPVVMGILNLTPDSFYDGGRWGKSEDALRQAAAMLEEGATFIDVGGMSARPGARPILEGEETQRVVPLIERLLREFPEAVVSVDTWRSGVALRACEAGASLINDISGGAFDPGLWPLLARLQVPYVLMHISGEPETMQMAPSYSRGPVLEVLDYFIEKVGRLRELGLRDILIDPGFGFGKQLSDNYQLLLHLEVFKILELPILVGISRKSMIYKLLDTTPEHALPGTAALHFAALDRGAQVLRAHDVRAAVEVVRLWTYLHETG